MGKVRKVRREKKPAEQAVDKKLLTHSAGTDLWSYIDAGLRQNGKYFTWDEHACTFMLRAAVLS